MTDAAFAEAVLRSLEKLDTACLDFIDADKSKPRDLQIVRQRFRDVKVCKAELLNHDLLRLDALAMKVLQSASGEWGSRVREELTGGQATNVEELLGYVRRRHPSLDNLAKLLRSKQQGAKTHGVNPLPATVDALLSECESHRIRIMTVMKRGQRFYRCTDANFAALMKGQKSGFFLPPFGRLFDAAVAFDLGDVPPLHREPRTGRKAVAVLDTLIQWCKAKKQQESSGAAIAGLEGQRPAVQLAWSQYQHAIQARSDLGERGTDREVYDFMKHTLAKDNDGVRLPAFDTWQRYLRSARRALNCRKHEPRHGRPHGSSIVRQDQIETGSQTDF